MVGRLVPPTVTRFVRDVTGVHPQVYEAPGSLGGPDHFREAVSDAFVWRSGRNYATRFDLMNLPALITPSQPCDDDVTFVVFDGEGTEIGRHSFLLEPFETRPLLLDDLLDGHSGLGTFAVFHSLRDGEEWPYASCLSERSYVRYRDPSQTELWSSVHGCCNSYVLAHDATTGQYRTLGRRALRKQTFSSQMRFDDCDRFEITYTNPLSVPAHISFLTEDPDGRPSRPIARDLKPMETTVFEFDNRDRDHVIIRHQSDVYAWRPLIFKFYSGQFDVLHS